MKKKASLTIESSKTKKRLPAQKEVPLTIGSPKPKKAASLTIGSSNPKGKLPAEQSKRTTRGAGKSKDALSKEHADGTTAVASSSKTVPKQVSKAGKKRGGVHASTPSRKNPLRKVRGDAKTNK
ncbi:hypothetical protein POM88_045231 [Heracleum sosnowskyi]|uniref:Uncharacterized protein n=1 Tax=Heracleum sosnowskyi TaxID=360622 RepID=A0AAD8H464_9APIA|nr:hypothetical protein POM88_045231 [Heracleum sosnowskyi]